MSKKVLITGIGGQDGYFLSKLILSRGDTLHGLLRPNSSQGRGTIEHLTAEEQSALILHEGNVTSKDFIDELIRFSQFDEIYHLAAQSSVARSIQHPRETIETNVLGITNIATAIRDKSPGSKLLFAGSSEMFGNLENSQQDESTHPHPQSPYGLAKEMGFQLINTYRQHYGIWGATAILFNHESEFRGEPFVTRKIVDSVVRIARGEKVRLSLGNMYVKRDWGYAEDYMRGLLLMMDRERPDDFVFATGQLRTVKDFVIRAFEKVGIAIDWTGEGLEERGLNHKTGEVVVQVDQRYYRPGDIIGTCGDASKARQQLGWAPQTDFEGLISKMIERRLAPSAPTNGST